LVGHVAGITVAIKMHNKIRPENLKRSNPLVKPEPRHKDNIKTDLTDLIN
jgi:hypothetical protein